MNSKDTNLRPHTDRLATAFYVRQFNIEETRAPVTLGGIARITLFIKVNLQRTILLHNIEARNSINDDNLILIF